MSTKQFIAVLIVYAIGSYACSQWAVAEGATATLGFLLWTSFFALSNAVSWALWWSREHWLG